MLNRNRGRGKHAGGLVISSKRIDELVTNPQFVDWPHMTSVTSGISPGERTDLIRYSALRIHGGVYCDFDVVPVRPFAELVAGCEVAAGFEATHHLIVSPSVLFVSNAVIVSTSGHPIWTAIADAICQGWDDMATLDTSHSKAGRTAERFSAVVKQWAARAHSNVVVHPANILHPQHAFLPCIVALMKDRKTCYTIHMGGLTGTQP